MHALLEYGLLIIVVIARKGPARPVSEQEAFARMAPGKPVRWVHAADHVERLIDLVAKHPWPPRSKELQVLLGVKQDPFLRIVDLALASRRLRREAQRSGTRYFVEEGAHGSRPRR